MSIKGMLTITDTDGQTAHIILKYVVAVIIPSLTSRGDGKCRVAMTSCIVTVDLENANLVLDAIKAGAIPDLRTLG